MLQGWDIGVCMVRVSFTKNEGKNISHTLTSSKGWVVNQSTTIGISLKDKLKLKKCKYEYWIAIEWDGFNS